jgi:hypothetical protein
MRWNRHVTSEFRESKKMFWKSVNRRMKPQEKLKEVVNDANVDIFNEGEQVVER